MNPVFLGGSLLIGALPAGILLALRLRRRPADATCSHRWTGQTAEGPWTCRWCDAIRQDCPHDTWFLPPGAGAWSCRSCGAWTGHVTAEV
jgi:hypothetical protein